MRISRTFFAWIIATASFATYYAIFGSLSVEGYESPPLRFRLLDIVTSAFLMMLFAGIMSLVLALFIWRKDKYAMRVSRLLPLSFIGIVVIMILTMATL